MTDIEIRILKKHLGFGRKGVVKAFAEQFPGILGSILKVDPSEITQSVTASYDLGRTPDASIFIRTDEVSTNKLFWTREAIERRIDHKCELPGWDVNLFLYRIGKEACSAAGFRCSVPFDQMTI